MRIEHRLRLRRQRHAAGQEVVAGPAAQRILHEVGQAVVVDRRRHHRPVQFLDVHDVRRRHGVVHAGAAADDEVVGTERLRRSRRAARSCRVGVALLVAEVAAHASVVDEDRRLGNAGRIGDAEVGIPAHAVVEGESIVDAPVVAEPEADASAAACPRPSCRGSSGRAAGRTGRDRQVPRRRVVPGARPGTWRRGRAGEC